MTEREILLRGYDEVCGAAYVNLFTLSKDSNTISLMGFDPKNKEHLFILGVAKGLAGAMGKDLCLDVTRWQLRKLNRGLDKDCRMKLMDGKEAIYAISPDQLLHFMRPNAKDRCGNDFTFADIYEEFYAKQKGKRK